MRKKGGIEITYIPSIILIFLFMFVGIFLIKEPSDRLSYIETFAVAETEKSMFDVLSYDVEGFEGDFADFLVETVKEGNIKENEVFVKEVLDKTLSSPYSFVVSSTGFKGDYYKFKDEESSSYKYATVELPFEREGKLSEIKIYLELS